MTIQATSHNNYSQQNQTNKQNNDVTNSTFEINQNNEEEQQTQNNTQTKESEETQIDFDKLWDMFKDIESVSRTGFTVEELEYIQKLIAQLQKMISEQSDNSSVDPDIQQKIDDIKKLIMQMQKEVSGEAIIKMDDDSSPTSDKESALNTLEQLSDIVNQMKSGSEKNDIKSLSTIEELMLAEQLREQEKNI